MKRKTKRTFKALLVAWHIVIIIIISALLIPLFLKNANSPTFYTWTTLMSILAYLLVTAIHLRMKKGVIKEYLESFCSRLLLAVIAIVVAFLASMYSTVLFSQVMLVTAAVLYATALQKFFFLRVIGL